VPACADAERSRGVVWVEPRVEVEVSFSEVMLGRLRDPVLRAVAPCGIPPTGAREK
jgi:hypothetical protein